jgi:hypothetical protein
VRAPYWHLDQAFFGPPVPKLDLYAPHFGDFQREIGITSTPVVDRGTGTIYVVAKSKRAGRYPQHLHALDLATGVPRPGSPAEIAAHVPGLSFERKVTLDETALGGPALAALGDGRLALAWTGTDAAHHVNVATTADGRAFAGTVTLKETSIDGPALAVLGGRTFLAWAGRDAGHRLNVASSPDPAAGFGRPVTLAASSAHSPALAAFLGRLVLAWTAADGRIHVVSSSDGTAFAGEAVLATDATAGPTLAVDGSRLLLAWPAGATLHVSPSADGKSFGRGVTLAQSSAHAPALGVDSAVRLVWAGTDPGRTLNLLTAPHGTTAFGGQVVYDGRERWAIRQSDNHNSSAAAPALAPYQGILACAWTGTDPARRLNVSWGLDLDSKRQLNRPGLLLQDGVLYLAFGSHGDQAPYHGWVLAYEAASLRQLAAFTTSPDTMGAGVWQSGAGLSSDGPHVYAVVGNGHNGGLDQGNGILQLSARSLRLAGSYSDPQANELSDRDLDLITAAVLRPVAGGAFQLVAAGKQGVAYALRTAGDGVTLTQRFAAAQSQLAGRYPNIHGSPVLWDAGPAVGVRMFLWGEEDHLRAYRLAADGFVLDQVSEMIVPPGMPGGFLTLTADAADASSAVLWVSLPKGDANHGTVLGRLLAFRATDVKSPLWDSDEHGGGHWFAKFCPPTVANGRVYLATFEDPGSHPAPNSLDVYGLV